MALNARATIFAAALAVLLGGCQTGKWGASEEWRLQNLEEKALGFSNSQLSHAERLDALEERMDQIDPAHKSMTLHDEKSQGEKPLLTSTDLPEPASAPQKEAASAKKASDWEKYPAVESKKSTRTVKVAGAKKPAKAAPMSMASGKALYEKGLADVLGGKSADGRELLERFIRENPKHSLLPNAQYWLGESYYHEKRFPEAVVAFKEVHRLYPKHPKAAASLLKLGYSYSSLGDKGNAKFYMNVLVQDYPNSDPAALARKTLRVMN